MELYELRLQEFQALLCVRRQRERRQQVMSNSNNNVRRNASLPPQMRIAVGIRGPKNIKKNNSQRPRVWAWPLKARRRKNKTNNNCSWRRGSGATPTAAAH